MFALLTHGVQDWGKIGFGSSYSPGTYVNGEDVTINTTEAQEVCACRALCRSQRPLCLPRCTRPVPSVSLNDGLCAQAAMISKPSCYSMNRLFPQDNAACGQQSD